MGIREEEEKREEEDRQKREEERKLKEEEEQVRRKKEVERMATADRERKEREQGENTAPPASKDLERAAASTAPTKYEPPSSPLGEIMMTRKTLGVLTRTVEGVMEEDGMKEVETVGLFHVVIVVVMR